jgi:osmoprotectant transport system ATP-binding protein
MIELEALTKRYGDQVVVDQLSLRAEPGELVVLLGTSGCGKTTTLKMINRLVEPSDGRVLLDGADVGSLPQHELRRRIGYVFQKVGLFPHMTVFENIGITPTLLGWSAERIHRRVDELLELVELDAAAMRDRRPDELSGGQQQRVGVARALAAEPTVMLLDEPFGALDPLTRDRLQQSFSRIRSQLAVTAVFVTHDLTEALLLGDRIVVMRDGRMVQEGTPHDLMVNPVDEFVEQMIGTPKRQAKLVDDLLGAGPPA